MTQILAQANDQDGMKIFLAGINDIGIFLPFENEVIILQNRVYDLWTWNTHIFEPKKVLTMQDEEKQEWFFYIVDVCAVLTDQYDYNLAKNYWKI